MLLDALTLGALNYDACAMADDGSCTYPPLSAGFTWTSACGLPETATFADISLGNVVTYDWTFESGQPASSMAETPVVSWDVPGSYNVTLTVGDGEGGTSVFMDVITVGENLHRLEIDITPDAFPQETSFAVLNANGDTLQMGRRRRFGCLRTRGMPIRVVDGQRRRWVFGRRNLSNPIRWSRVAGRRALRCRATDLDGMPCWAAAVTTL